MPLPLRRRKYSKKRPLRRARAPRQLRAKRLRARVPRPLARISETKEVTFYLEESLTYGNFTNGAYNCVALSPYDPLNLPYGPNVLQGVGEGNRIGNQIVPVRCTFSGVIWPNPYSAQSNANPEPVEVCMWIFSPKANVKYGSPADLQNNILAKFFQYGNNTLPISGQMQDIMLPPNKDVIHLWKKRVFKLGNSAYFNWGGANTPNNASNQFLNNDFKLNCRFRVDFTKFMPRKVVWNDTDTVPTSRPVFAVIVPYYAAGGLPVDPGGVNSAPLKMNVNMTIRYKDM